jgi:hypothetical protein
MGSGISGAKMRLWRALLCACWGLRRKMLQSLAINYRGFWKSYLCLDWTLVELPK